MDAESGLELAAARLVDEKTVPALLVVDNSRHRWGDNYTSAVRAEPSSIDYKKVDPHSRPGYPPLGDRQGGPQGKTKEVAMIVTAGGRDHSLLVATYPQSPLTLPTPSLCISP